MAIPSIAFIPSGYKANKVYSVLPTDGAGDLDFTRAGSARRFNKQGLLETVVTGVPRLDYSDGGCPSLLLELQSTNLLLNSQTFTATEWLGSAGTLATTTTLTPANTTDAVRVTSANSSTDLRQVITITSGVTYTNSAWVRRVSGTSSIQLITVNGIFTGIPVTSEWQRFSTTVTANSTTGRFYIKASNVGDVFEVWGAQLEALPYATSYTPTSGAIATRLADTASKTGLGSYINSSEGVLYLEGSALANDLTSRNITLYGSSGNFIKFIYSSNSNRVDFVCSSNGGVSCNIVYNLTDTTENTKFALKWKLNDFALWINGVEVGTDTGGNAPTGMDTISFTNEGGSGNFYGKTKDVRVYNTALTDAELTTLTTL